MGSGELEKNGQNSKPNQLRLEPNSNQHEGLNNSLHILKTLLEAAWLNHPRWEGTRKLLKKLLRSIQFKVAELKKSQIRSYESKQNKMFDKKYITKA